MTQTLSDSTLQNLIEEYMQGSFESDPIMAAYMGLHEYDGKVPDLSQRAIEKRINTLHNLEGRVEQLAETSLDKEGRFDRTLLLGAIRKELFSLEDLREYANNPIVYSGVVEVSTYIKRDYAPIKQRLEALVRHLEQVPPVLTHAQANLVESLPKPALETALGMYEGVITYYETDVAKEFDQHAQPELKGRFELARNNAVGAVREFINFLKTRLPQASMDFAIGADKYRKMLATGEMVDLPVEKVLEVGRRDLAKNQRELERICESYRPDVPVKEVMRELQAHHPTPETLISDTVAKLEEVRQFLIDHKIVTVPSEVRCLVTETPPFLRWAFAFMDAPGPFEQVAKEAYYYITPVEPDWTPQQKEEWLTKFDYYTLQDVSIHEAYPGHYLHFLHTRLVKSRLRQMLWAYSFVEGWAHYTEQMMLEEGFESADPRYKIAQLSEALLRDSRYIVAIMMHTQGMSVDEATRFIMENAYMEETPSRSEAVRGTFDPGYLNYTLGKLLLLKLREDYKAEQGENFNLQNFHDLVLSYGAPPVPLLRTVTLKNPGGDIL
ncbi:MAG TPA: DUF885 domain-containing protein [Chloroflexia bacterium]|nr:DUF885 domain-containing protein [Chloroflexia bacterium]